MFNQFYYLIWTKTTFIVSTSRIINQSTYWLFLRFVIREIETKEVFEMRLQTWVYSLSLSWNLFDCYAVGKRSVTVILTSCFTLLHYFLFIICFTLFCYHSFSVILSGLLYADDDDSHANDGQGQNAKIRNFFLFKTHIFLRLVQTASLL